jgi:hypothetical protein
VRSENSEVEHVVGRSTYQSPDRSPLLVNDDGLRRRSRAWRGLRRGFPCWAVDACFGHCVKARCASICSQWTQASSNEKREVESCAKQRSNGAFFNSILWHYRLPAASACRMSGVGLRRG